MTGTLINTGAILVGSLIGIFLGSRLPERLRQTVIQGIGLVVLALGFHMFLETKNPLIVLASVLLGILLGEWWHVEEGVENLGKWIEKIAIKNLKLKRGRFLEGFLTTSLLYCTGPLAILGALQDGLTGDYNILAAKSMMDGFASIAFSSTLGIGVLFSSLPILVYQGSISMLAAQVQPLITPEMINEMTATGGVLMIALAISSVLEIRRIRIGSFLPALFVAPLLTAIMAALGWL